MEKEKNNMHINFAKVENQLKYRQFHLYFIRFLLFKYFFDKEFIIPKFLFCIMERFRVENSGSQVFLLRH